MLRLYYMRNTCALASHIALEEAGASYEAVRVDFASSEQRKPEYLAINPKGRVPALVTERGILTETPAILVFIAQSFPKAGLAPLNDPFAFAQAQAFNSYLCSTVHVAHAHRMRGYALAMREERAKALGIRALGDLAKHPELKLGLSQEFIGRKDGWPGLKEAYKLPFRTPQGLDHGLAYGAIAAGKIDVMGIYTTDAKIGRYKLLALEDDSKYFSRYEILAGAIPAAVLALIVQGAFELGERRFAWMSRTGGRS